MSKTIDINCDMGEGFGAYTMGDDTGMMEVVSTVNLACGFHAGDPSIMQNTLERAKVGGIAVGAHPGYPDLWGFGRRSMVYTPKQLQQLVAYQVGAAMGMASASGYAITHVKAHGALGHLVSDDKDAGQIFADVVRAVDTSLILCTIANSSLHRIGLEKGMRVVSEIYADRAYLDDGRLMPRSQPGSVIHDAEESAKRVRAMVDGQCLISYTGKRIPVDIDTVCVHGDTPDAVHIARRIRRELESAEYAIAPYAEVA